MSHNGKPPRAGDYPRITFHAQDRAFDRLLKENSLSDLKKTVRTKLGLKSGSVVHLVQLRHGQSVDLEDEGDFDAFYSLAYEQRLVAVQVTLADGPSAEEPMEEQRPRKKHKRKHEVYTLPEQEAEPHVENYVSFGKKRKVAFTEPTGGLEEPQKKITKDDSSSSSVAAVAESDRSSSHDSFEALKKKKHSSSHDTTGEPKNKKKRKRKSTVDSGADDSELPSAPEHSTLNEQEDPMAVDASATLSREIEDAPTTSLTLEESPGVSVSSTTKTAKKKASSRRKPDPGNEKEAKPTRSPASNVYDANGEYSRRLWNAEDDVPPASSGSPDGAQKDDDLARNVRDKDECNVLDYSKGETRNRKRSSTVNANNTKTLSNIDNGQIEAVPTTAEKSTTNSEDASSIVKEIVSKVTRKKKSTGGSPDSAPVDGRAVRNNKIKVPEDGAKRGAGSSKASAEASTICLVCNKTQKHELVDCPIVKDGPASIQKRIKSLRARKIPDHEKLPLISELQKIKAEQRESEKQKARGVRNVAIELRSQSALSSSTDEGTKDVGGHMNDVAGVSKESRPVNQAALSGGRSSETPSDETVSLDAGTHPIIDREWVNNNDPIALPDVGDVPGLASFDLDTLMKGPESSFLSINDMTSSDNDSDEEEKMSGEPDSDEVENMFAKLMQDDSSDSDTNDSQRDEPDESEKPVVGPSKIQSPETDHSSGPKHSEDGDTPGNSGSDVNAVRDVESIETTGPSGGQTDDTASAPNVHSSSSNLMSTSEEKQNINDDWEAKQDPLEGMSSSEEPLMRRKGREGSSLQGGASSGRKHVKPTKITKKTDGVSLSQVSKELEESAARKTPARAKNKLASNTSNRSAAKLAADAASVQRSTTSVDNWTAWKEELSSHPDDEGSTLVDELFSSPVPTRPQPRQNKKALNGTTSKDDISEPPNSQPSLPLSKKTRLQDPIEDAESNSEKDAKDGDSRRRTRNSRYRRLSEIRSESIHKSLQVPRMTPSTPRDKAAELYGKRGRANEDESSSDSDSEVEKQSHSHIPKKRVAGTSV